MERSCTAAALPFPAKAVAHWAVICYNEYADGRTERDPPPDALCVRRRENQAKVRR